MKTYLFCLFFVLTIIGCQDHWDSADGQRQRQQEQLQAEAISQIGMPAIKNYRELRLSKLLLELRDQNDLSTFTYVWSDFQGRWAFLCNSIGYGLPYAVQFTNPQKVAGYLTQGGYAIIPQAEPNGLFSPDSVEGTWVMCKDPKGPDVKPVYVEPRVMVSPFELEPSAGVGLEGKK
jgi:hypothetical protein